jgi:L-amino acid N-acyltransferase YncA
MNIIPDNMAIRPVDLKDMDWLFGLRNNPKFSEWFKSPGKVRYIEHKVWFEQILIRNEDLMYVIDIDGFPAGYIRCHTVANFDGDLKRVELSVGVDPSDQGKGLASLLIEHAMSQNFAEKEIVEYFAQVHESNKASHALFLKFGFERDRVTPVSNGFVTYALGKNSIG